MFEKPILDGYAGLIFDMDGTLIDTMPVHARAWGLVGEQFGYRFNSQIRRCHGANYRCCNYAGGRYATAAFG